MEVLFFGKLNKKCRWNRRLQFGIPKVDMFF